MSPNYIVFRGSRYRFIDKDKGLFFHESAFQSKANYPSVNCISPILLTCLLGNCLTFVQLNLSGHMKRGLDPSYIIVIIIIALNIEMTTLVF